MADPLVDTLLTRLPFERRFDLPDTFASLYAAERWLADRGFCFGPTQEGGPVAVFHGDGLVSKWRNLSRKERLAVDGLILRGRNSYREDVVVRLARDPGADPAGLTAQDIASLAPPSASPPVRDGGRESAPRKTS